MTGEREPWSDERVAAAYRARFGAAQADGLESVTVDVVRRTRRPLLHVPVAALRAAVAAVLVVAVAGSATVLAPLLDEVDPGPSPGPTGPTSGDVIFPDAVLGLRVVSVSDAITLRDTALSDTEIAVRGFIPPPPSIPPTCPAPLVEPTPIELRCPEPFTAWLTETPEQLFAQAENGIAASPPEGPALQYVRRVEVPWASTGPEPRTEPIPVVLVGHFSDFRSDQCPGEQRATCRFGFVVDARAWAAGFEAGVDPVEALLDEPMPRLSADEVAALSGRFGPALTEPWIAALDRSLLADVDPRAALHPELDTAKVIWVVRELVSEGGRPVARTMFVADDSGAAFAMLSGGVIAIDALGAPEAAFPSEILGLEVISIAEAIALRDAAEVDDTARAVAGWYADTGQEVECPAVLPRSIVALRCPDGFRWLVSEPQPTFEVVNGGVPRPQGPALNPLVRPEVPFDLDGEVAEDGFEPVILLGHFDDWRRQRLDEQLHFVVDAVLWRDGDIVAPREVHLDAVPVTDAGVVEALIDQRLGPARVSWSTVLRGSVVRNYDPNGVVAFDAADQLWRVRRLVEQGGRPVVRTAWVIDGDDRVWWEADCGGCVMLLPSHTIPLHDDVRLDVVDSTGGVVSVAPAPDGAPDDGFLRFPAGEHHPEVTISRGDGPNVIRVDWMGGLCDTTWTLGIWDPGPSINLSHPPIGACRAAGVLRGVLITFDRPIDIDDVDVVHVMTGG